MPQAHTVTPEWLKSIAPEAAVNSNVLNIFNSFNDGDQCLAQVMQSVTGKQRASVLAMLHFTLEVWLTPSNVSPDLSSHQTPPLSTVMHFLSSVMSIHQQKWLDQVAKNLQQPIQCCCVLTTCTLSKFKHAVT